MRKQFSFCFVAMLATAIVALFNPSAWALPLTSSSLLLHLDAGNVNGDETNPASGTGVSLWKDLSGNNNDFDQAIVARQPLYQPTQGPGNLTPTPAVVFDGTDDFLFRSTGITHEDTTIFYIGKVQSGFFIYVDQGGSAHRNLLIFGAGGAARSWGRDASDDVVQVNSAATSDFRLNVSWIEDQKMNARQKVGTDAFTQVASAQNASYDGGVWTATFGISIGAEANTTTGPGGSASHANLLLSEFIMYDGVMSVADRTAVEDFLVAKYFEQTAIPEPSTLGLLGIGLVGMVASTRRRKSS